MAFPTPAAVFLDENMQIHRGKRTDAPGAKPLKPSGKPGLQERKALQDVSNMKPGLQERKALRDVSNMKPGLQERKALRDVSNLKPGLASNISKGTALKERPRSHEAVKNPGNKTVIFADNETTKCHEWAKDGVECANLYDSQKFDKDVQDKRVKKKVEKVKGKVESALHGWSDVVFGPLMFPDKEVAMFFEEVKGLELEPEILPDMSNRAKQAEDSFTDDALDWYPFLDDKPVEFQLRDEPAVPGIGVN